MMNNFAPQEKEQSRRWRMKKSDPPLRNTTYFSGLFVATDYPNAEGLVICWTNRRGVWVS